MSRLRQGVKEGKQTGLDVGFLWACIQNSEIGTVSQMTFYIPQLFSLPTPNFTWNSLSRIGSY